MMQRIEGYIIFLVILLAVMAGVHAYLYWRLTYYLRLSQGMKTGLAVFLVLAAVITVLCLPLSRMLPLYEASVLTRAVFPWLGVLLLLLACCAIADCVWLFSSLISVPQNPARRDFLRHGVGVALLAGAGGLSAFAARKASLFPTVKQVSVVLKRWPSALDGLRVVQISDLHIGPASPKGFVREVVRQVMELKPDLVAITGDLVDASVADLAGEVSALSFLSAKYGVYFVTGNHEYYSGVDEWCAYLPTLGLTVLRNEHVTLGDKAASFDVAGVEDWSARRHGGAGSDLGRALQGRDSQRPVLLLAHQPASVADAELAGVDLQLSGHTHGGQIWPFGLLVLLQQPFVKGLHRRGETQVYVNSGTGLWGPPMRLDSENEITLLTIQST